jgi:hypothetical protein
MKDHKTKSITIKRADVDVPMIPLINWLNSSFGDLTTEFCCQGDKNSGCYVLFRCFDWQELDRLARLLRSHGLVAELFISAPSMPYPRFRIDFKTLDRMQAFFDKEVKGSINNGN